MTEHAWCLLAARGCVLDAVTHGGLPELTPAEVAIAAAGLPRLPWIAALYSLAGDDSVRGPLKWALVEYLLGERERHGWAQRVERLDGTRTTFCERLIDVFLVEERRPAWFQAAPQLRALALGVEPETWRRVVMQQWQAVAAEYGRWRLDAEEHVRRRLRAS